jgi:hypothetical protein
MLARIKKSNGAVENCRTMWRFQCASGIFAQNQTLVSVEAFAEAPKTNDEDISTLTA